MLQRKTKSDQDLRDTVKRQLIELHYENLGDELYWTTERYRALCHALGLTVWELGAYVRASISETDRWLFQGKFPKAVELHLTFIERVALRKPADKSILPPI